jgi:hypothetical protein
MDAPPGCCGGAGFASGSDLRLLVYHIRCSEHDFGPILEPVRVELKKVDGRWLVEHITAI